MAQAPSLPPLLPPPSLRGDELSHYDLGLTPWGKQLQEKWKKGWKDIGRLI